MIRTDSVDADFYNRVLDRIERRDRRPQGIALHLAGRSASELFVITVYRDEIAMADMFRMFTAPEMSNELQASGVTADISRHEFSVERLWISESVQPSRQRPLSRPRYAYLFADPIMTADVYEEAIDRSHFPERWPDGLLIHMVTSRGVRFGVVDIWDSPEKAKQHYVASIIPNSSIASGTEISLAGVGDNWISLHALSVLLEPSDPLRWFSQTDVLSDHRPAPGT